MKAIRLIQPGRPLQLQDVPIPALGPRDALVRVKAAGICHSDAHYRAGTSRVYPLPLTLGHEVAGIVEQVGAEAEGVQTGERVCVNYLVTCGQCAACLGGKEQFCATASMIGKYRDGGFAEWIVVPARNVFALPESLPLEQAALLMCSSATSLHALRKARLREGETVAVFGLGGLGTSAVQLALALGAGKVLGVDLNPLKLQNAERYGVIPVDASQRNPVERIRELTSGRGVDVALELIGLPLTMHQALLALAPGGRAALAGITDKTLTIGPYQELLNKEAELIGVSDHLRSEIPELIAFSQQGKLNLATAVTRTVALDAQVVNAVLDGLEHFGDDVRVVVTP